MADVESSLAKVVIFLGSDPASPKSFWPVGTERINGQADCALLLRKWVLEMIPWLKSIPLVSRSVGKDLERVLDYIFCHSLVTLVRRSIWKDPFWTCKPFTRGFFAGDPDFIGVLCWKGSSALLLIWTQTMVYGLFAVFVFVWLRAQVAVEGNCCCSFKTVGTSPLLSITYNCSRYSCYCGRRSWYRASSDTIPYGWVLDGSVWLAWVVGS